MTPEYNFLRDHAQKNVWCSPEQDLQFILKPKRASSASGAIRSLKLAWQTQPMPDMTSRWHVFVVGGINPIAFNLFANMQDWVCMVDAANQQKMVINLYTINGVELPRAECYYTYNEMGAMVIAVRVNVRLSANVGVDDLYVRVYSNRYYQTAEAAALTQSFEVYGKLMESQADITAFNTKFLALQGTAAPGTLTYYYNGVARKEYLAGTVSVGDVAEYTYDSSVKAEYRIQVKDLQAFESILDVKRKLLVHYNGASPTTIDYYDDVDFLIEGVGDRPRQLYYHHNSEDAIRQVTFRDYALVASYVQRYSDRIISFEGAGASENHTLVVRIRKSGYNRPLTYEAQRTLELYKMQDGDVLRAMVGIDATVPEWQAANLENGAYTKLMRQRIAGVTSDLAEQAYGYYAMSYYMANTPSAVESFGNNAYVTVPFLLMYGATAYEYDADGLMIGWYQHLVGERYYTKNVTTTTVELVSGLGGITLDETHGLTTVPVKSNRNYKVYQRTKISGVLQPGFTDVTGSNKYTISNGVFQWTSTSLTAYPTLRSDSRFYAADYNVALQDGQLKLYLQTNQVRDGVSTLSNLVIPLGQLDVFLNEHSLIRGLEYFYKDGYIQITAKKYLVMPITTLQKVHVRMRGFCNADGTIVAEGDVGYIEHGLLSNNSHYDLRDGKVQRIVVGGALVTKANLLFSEESNQVAVENSSNGTPYMVKDLLVTLKPVVADDTGVLWNQAIATEKRVSDYLSSRIPQPDRGALVAIPERYQVFSPFVCRILFDLKYNRLILPGSKPFTRQDVIALCKGYESLLAVDPISRREVVDTRYVSIQPHSLPTALSITARQYQFLEQVVLYYAPGLVDLSAGVSITA